MTKCVVPGCASTYKNINLRFFRFPNVKSKWPKALTKKRFKLWCYALGFQHQFNPENKYVCNLHFVSDTAATLFDISNVDWVPTLNLPEAQSLVDSESENNITSDCSSSLDDSIQESQASHEPEHEISPLILHPTVPAAELQGKPRKQLRTPDNESTDQENSDASINEPKRKRLNQDDEPTSDDDFQDDKSVLSLNQDDDPAPVADGKDVDNLEDEHNSQKLCGQECKNCQLMTHYRQELQRQFERLNYLSAELIKCRKGIAWLNNDEKCKRYTGISSYAVLKHIYEYVKPYMFEPSCELSKDETFVMTFRRLRKNTTFVELADDYSICINTASKYFHRTVKVIHDCLQYALALPSKENSIRHTPQAFKRYYGNRRVLVMDCFEVQTERPGLPKAANAHHSAYKMTYTAKFLIVMAADGSVAFVSNAYVGRCSDRLITSSSGFLDLIEPDDVILADKGFDIADMITSRGAILNIPTFLRKNSQMNPINIERDRQITSLRVHVERIIGQIKEKYNILNGPIEVNSLRRSENNYNSLDLIVRLACILISFNKSIVYR